MIPFWIVDCLDYLIFIGYEILITLFNNCNGSDREARTSKTFTKVTKDLQNIMCLGQQSLVTTAFLAPKLSASSEKNYP